MAWYSFLKVQNFSPGVYALITCILFTNQCGCSVDVFLECSEAHFGQKNHVDNCCPVLVHSTKRDDGTVTSELDLYPHNHMSTCCPIYIMSVLEEEHTTAYIKCF